MVWQRKFCTSIWYSTSHLKMWETLSICNTPIQKQRIVSNNGVSSNTDTVVDTISYGIFVSVRPTLIKIVADMLGSLYNPALKNHFLRGTYCKKVVKTKQQNMSKRYHLINDTAFIYFIILSEIPPIILVTRSSPYSLYSREA